MHLLPFVLLHHFILKPRFRVFELTGFIPDMLHMQLREVILIPNPTANRDGNFTVVSGMTLDPGGTGMKRLTPVFTGACSWGDAD